VIFTGPCLRASRRSPGAPSIDGTQSRDRGRLLLACSTLARFARHPCRSPRVVPFLSIGAAHLTGCRGLSLAKGASIDFCNQLLFTSTRNPSDSRASRHSPLRGPARLSPRRRRAPFSARLRVTTPFDAASRASIRQAGPLSRSSLGPTAAAFSTTCGVAVEPLALSFALRIPLPIFESLGLVLPAARQRDQRSEPENAFHLWRDPRTTEVARRSVTCSAHLQRGGTS
jgi:hypothetical protein